MSFYEGALKKCKMAQTLYMFLKTSNCRLTCQSHALLKYEMKANTLITVRQVATVSNVIEAERFETLHRLYREAAYVNRFLKILRKKFKAGLTTQDLLS